MVFSTLLVASLAVAAHASNDWNKPCLSGVCSYDIPNSAGSSSGSLKVWGSPDAISDITTAAGWEIIDCSPDQLGQDIRLVCNSDDSKAAGCSHLYEGSGAEGKIVRLPESCGKNAFARVARAWVPDDQSIPNSIAGKIVRRDGSQPQVKALTLDTNFNAVDPYKVGPVNFAVQGANIKGAAADIDTSTVRPGRRSRIYGKENIERGLTDFVGNAIDSITKLQTFNQSKTLDPFNIDKPFNLLNEELSCPPVTVSLAIDVDAKANAVATIGVAASGTIIPPKINDFSVITSLTGDIDGSVTMKATATGTLDSGKLPIIPAVGIPGLDFPGLLTIGPSFEVNGQASAGLDIQADMTVGLNYHFENAQLTFPSGNTNKKANPFTIGDTPLKLSVSPSVKATGNVQVHLIPTLNLGVSALGGIVDANIFLDLDASAEMVLSLEATAEASTTVGKAKRENPTSVGRYMPRSIAANAPPRKSAAPVTTTVLDPKATKTGSQIKSTGKVTKTATSAVVTSAITAKPAKSSSGTVVVTTHATNSTAKVTTKTESKIGTGKTSTVTSSTTASTAATPADSGTASFGGCFTINAGLDVSAGADANFFGLFDGNTQVSLFNKTFEIFQKCFGNQKRSLPVISSLKRESLKKRAGLTCPVSKSTPVSVTDKVVKAGTIASRTA